MFCPPLNIDYLSTATGLNQSKLILLLSIKNNKHLNNDHFFGVQKVVIVNRFDCFSFKDKRKTLRGCKIGKVEFKKVFAPLKSVLINVFRSKHLMWFQ